MIKKKIIALAVLLLLAATVLSGIPVAALGGEPSSIDCSNPDSPVAPKEIKASEFITLLGGGEVGKAEADYVDSVLEEAFVYSDRIPTGKVDMRYDGEKIYVSAREYEYTSESGISVKWVPSRVTLGGESYPLTYSREEDGYLCEISYAAMPSADGEELYANIEYHFEITVKRENADSYMNYAYRRAVAINKEVNEYNIQLAAYNSYTEYLEKLRVYNAANELYQKYLKDKATYDAAKARYEKYLTDLEEYNRNYEAYLLYRDSVEMFDERLAAYNAYLAAKEEYDIALPAYRNYLAVMEKAEKKLAVMENMFLANSKSQVMYSTLKGPTVQQVLDNQDTLISYGKVDPEVITQTGDATDALKELLDGYKAQTDFHGKYNYYVSNYGKIKENFIILYRNLHQLYQNGAVYTGIVQKERLNRYVEFVCHLYVLQSCLDDGFTIDETWKIHREYSEQKRDYLYYNYKEILEACQILPDGNNYSPADLPILPEKQNEPIEPEKVDAPVILPEVSEPLKPDEVTEPTAPEEVSKPEKPAEVPFAERPEERRYTSAEQALYEAYLGGRLSERSVSGDVKLRLVSSCRKLVPLGERYVVTFYDDDGETVLYRYNSNYSEIAHYDGETPFKAATDKYTYTFDGWKTEDGRAAEFGEVTENETVFYASYKAELNRYTVVWNVDGTTVEEQYDYGQIPAFGGSTEKKADARNVYTFIGWDTVPEKVTGNAIYIAQYSVSDRLYKVTFDFGGTIYEEQYKYGEMPVFGYGTERPDDATYTYAFKKWDKTFEAVTEDAVYTAEFEKKALLEDESGGALNVTPPTPELDNSYSAAVLGNEVRAEAISAIAKKNKAGVALSWLTGECTVMLPEKAVSEFSDQNGAYISLEKGDGYTYTLRLLASDRGEMSLEAPLSVIIKNSNFNESTRAYLRDENGAETRIPSSYSEAGITVKLTAGGTVILKNEYSISAESFEGGVLTFDMREVEAGAKVKFIFAIDKDYSVKEITVTGVQSGNKYTLDADGFLTMPAESVTVSVKTEERIYTVVFMSDGKVVSTKQYKKGETIERPDDPTKDATEEFIYQFLEWDPLFTEGATVSDDVTYNAVFRELRIEDQKGFVPKEDNRFWVFVITVLSLFLVFVILIITIIIMLVKRKKKKRSSRKQ